MSKQRIDLERNYSAMRKVKNPLQKEGIIKKAISKIKQNKKEKAESKAAYEGAKARAAAEGRKF